MQTIKISANEKTILVRRVTGFAVSIRVSAWNVTARSFVMGWQTIGKRLDYATANALFASHA